MTGLHVTFIYPWLLLLLLPAFALVLIPYFRVAKRYRRTRNRIVKIILSLTVMTFAVLALSGLRFEYFISNDSNEIILLVDVSDTEEQAAETRDEFVNNVIGQSKYGNFKVGVVTFGFDQKYAVPMTYDVDGVYEKYINADLPDQSATDIEAALVYAASLFEHPETGKIVLITDGKETDGKATSVVRSIKSSGIRVDVAEIPSSYEGQYVDIVGLEKPEYHVGVNEEVTFTATLISNVSGQVAVNLYDNDENVLTEYADIVEGENTVLLGYLFRTDGVHELVAKIDIGDDTVTQNNVYRTYVLIEKFNKVLIYERNSGEADTLYEILTENQEYDVEVINVLEDEEEVIFKTVDGLRAYDEVILCNISNADLPEGMDKNLHDYVNEYGGGLFTVGGDKDPYATNVEANAYSREDLYGSLLQRMLPVQAIDYTPPLGVIVIVDTSGSMSERDNGSSMTRLEWAVEGAKSALRALSERDYFGLMTLSDDYSTILPLTPRTRETQIINAIETLEKANGGTVFSASINRAGEELRALKNVDKKHIIIVSDGEVPPEDIELYEDFINRYYTEDNITLSVAMINSGNMEAENQMRHAVGLGHGRFYSIKDSSSLVSKMREDLEVPAITEVEYKTFNPTIASLTSNLVKDLPRNQAEGKTDQLDVQLDGFYGVKVRAAADLILKGEFEVPIYAQWKYGEGMVGSIMVDVAGRFASNFTASDTGKTFLKNVVANLMPLKNIRPSDISVNLREDNYLNGMSVFSDLDEGEKIEGYIENIATGQTVSISTLPESADKDAPVYVTSALGADSGYTRANFVVKEGGIYKITLNKVDEDGTITSSTETYKQFSYSKEYDMTAFSDGAQIKETLSTIADRGSGAYIEDLEEYFKVFDGFVTILDRTFDPTLVLAISAIVLFLLEICVRKFKFKWIHEIIKERKEKRFSNKK